jgi:guanidinopropionase
MDKVNKNEQPAKVETNANQGLNRWIYYLDVATFLKCPLDRDPKNADISLVGVPYVGGNPLEKRQILAPRAIRHASTRYNKMNRTGIDPYAIAAIHDIGDVPFNELLDPNKAIKEIEAFFSEIFAADSTPIAIGGDHSITAGILRAFKKHAPEKPIALIHFDAHSDAMDPCWGIAEHCGAPFKIAFDENIVDPQKTFQIGIRGPIGSVNHDDAVLSRGVKIISPKDLDKMGVEALIKEIRKQVGDTPIYISLDIDALDPVYAPDTGTPELCGLTPSQVIDIIQGLRGLEIVGADLVCVAPSGDMSNITLITASGLFFELACLTAESITIHKKNIRKKKS